MADGTLSVCEGRIIDAMDIGQKTKRRWGQRRPPRGEFRIFRALVKIDARWWRIDAGFLMLDEGRKRIFFRSLGRKKSRF